jgi:hypothetical protein
MKKNVVAVFLSPKTSAQISGCLPRFAGSAAGWKPTTPKDDSLSKSFFNNLDQPKQKMTSGALPLIQLIDSSEFMSSVYRQGIPYFSQTELRST